MSATILLFALLAQVKPESTRTELPSLAKVLARMKENEALYQNLDLTYEQNLKLILPVSKLKGKNSKTASKSSHVVTQGERYYGKFVESFAWTDGTDQVLTFVMAFDGKTTRTNVQEKFGNIEHARAVTTNWLTPQRMAFLELPQDFALSDWIGFGTPVKLSPQYRAYSVSSRIIGEEKVDEIPCIKIETVYEKVNQKPDTRFIYWVAPTRNYLTPSIGILQS